MAATFHADNRKTRQRPEPRSTIQAAGILSGNELPYGRQLCVIKQRTAVRIITDRQSLFVAGALTLNWTHLVTHLLLTCCSRAQTCMGCNSKIEKTQCAWRETESLNNSVNTEPILTFCAEFVSSLFCSNCHHCHWPYAQTDKCNKKQGSQKLPRLLFEVVEVQNCFSPFAMPCATIDQSYSCTGPKGD